MQRQCLVYIRLLHLESVQKGLLKLSIFLVLIFETWSQIAAGTNKARFVDVDEGPRPQPTFHTVHSQGLTCRSPHPTLYVEAYTTLSVGHRDIHVYIIMHSSKVLKVGHRVCYSVRMSGIINNHGEWHIASSWLNGVLSFCSVLLEVSYR